MTVGYSALTVMSFTPLESYADAFLGAKAKLTKKRVDEIDKE
jgi:hypothetical protein